MDALTVAAKFYVIIPPLDIIECSGLLEAVDVCFKSFWVFALEYPKQVSSVWNFFSMFYDFDNVGKRGGRARITPQVADLQNFLRNTSLVVRKKKNPPLGYCRPTCADFTKYNRLRLTESAEKGVGVRLRKADMIKSPVKL
jgi:hypothetical protein